MTTVLNFIAVFRHVSEKMQIFQKRYQNRPSCKSLQHFFKWIHSWIPILHLQHLHIIRRAHITRPQCFIYFIPSMLFIHSPVISAKHPARCYQFLHTMHFFLQPPSCLKPSSVAYWMSRSACSPNFLIVFYSPVLVSSSIFVIHLSQGKNKTLWGCLVQCGNQFANHCSVRGKC